MRRQSSVTARCAGLLVGAGVATAALGRVRAHGGALRSASSEGLAIPNWLFLLTGAGVVGASFLLATFLTDRRQLEAVQDVRTAFPAPVATGRWLARLVGLLGFGFVLVAGFWGPLEELRNAAVLLVWVAWWAGLVMVTYLIGNAWPALDPARTLLIAVPTSITDEGLFSYPSWLGGWPAVPAVLGIVSLEILLPLATDPRLLGTVVAGYVALSVSGAVCFGTDSWFDSVDPVSRLFSIYGQLGICSRTTAGFSVELPGSTLVGASFEETDVAFAIAVLWGTTFDGLVGTGLWADAVRPAVAAGVPAVVVYLLALAAGYVLFSVAFEAAIRLARRTAPTYQSPAVLASRFAPSLVPIAAGYHLAHYFDYTLTVLPALVSAVSAPLDPPRVTTLLLGSWVGGLALAFVLMGHLLALWVAHATAFRTFPGRIQSIRSQYPLVCVMIAYTASSLWIVSEPAVTPPFV